MNAEAIPTGHHGSSRHVKRAKAKHWFSIGMLVLSILSTAFSAAYLSVAIWSPGYGKKISLNGVITPSAASVLTALFAKFIEISFATVFVAYLGQKLSRRAFSDDARDAVSLAELNMRNWIAQPGTIATQWETVRYAGTSFLGALSLLAAISILLYSTASNALVQPRLATRLRHEQMQSKYEAQAYAHGADGCKLVFERRSPTHVTLLMTAHHQ